MRLGSSKRLRLSTEMPIYIMLIGMLLIQIGNPQQIDIIVSLGTWLILFSAVISFMSALLNSRIEKGALLRYVLLSVVVLCSVIISFSWQYRNIVVALSFLELPLFFLAYKKDSSKYVARAIYATFLILSVVYSIISLTPLANIYYTEYGSRQKEFLTLGYNNPNETAMYLFVCLIVLIVLFSKLKHRLGRLIVAVDIGLILRLLVLTQSRTAILMSCLFILLAMVYKKGYTSKQFRIFCLFLPVLFIFLIFLNQYFDLDIYILSETLDTGRSDIYSTVLNEMSLSDFLFGVFEFQFQNLHNAYWSIFATIGFIGVILFISILDIKLRQLQERARVENDMRIALIGLLCIILYTSTEAAYLTAGGTWAASVMSVFLLCVFNEQRDVKNFRSKSLGL